MPASSPTTPSVIPVVYLGPKLLPPHLSPHSWGSMWSYDQWKEQSPQLPSPKHTPSLVLTPSARGPLSRPQKNTALSCHGGTSIQTLFHLGSPEAPLCQQTSFSGVPITLPNSLAYPIIKYYAKGCTILKNFPLSIFFFPSKLLISFFCWFS